MKSDILMQIGISIVMICILIGIVVLIIAQMGIQITDNNQLTYEKCCGGNVCSDTYYDTEDKKCKLVFEEQQKYSPYGSLSVISIFIALGSALILSFIIKLINFPDYLSNEEQHFDSFDSGEPR